MKATQGLSTRHFGRQRCWSCVYYIVLILRCTRGRSHSSFAEQNASAFESDSRLADERRISRSTPAARCVFPLGSFRFKTPLAMLWQKKVLAREFTPALTFSKS